MLLPLSIWLLFPRGSSEEPSIAEFEADIGETTLSFGFCILCQIFQQLSAMGVRITHRGRCDEVDKKNKISDHAYRLLRVHKASSRTVKTSACEDVPKLLV